MQRYREVLHHLNTALDIMIDSGDAAMTAAIAHPIAIAERRILECQATLIQQHFPPAAATPPKTAA